MRDGSVRGTPSKRRKKQKMTKKRMEVKRSSAVFWLLGVLVLGGLLGSLATAKTGLAPVAVTGAKAVFQVAKSEPLVNAASLTEGFRPLVEKAQPSVVSVLATRVTEVQQGQSPFASPFFRDFFGGQFDVPQERREQGLGSGLVVSDDGYILTNNHVVDKASDIKVSLADGREVNAKVVGTDPQTDLAVLKVDETGLSHLTLGDSSTVGVGDIVLAMGNPFGIGQTVTMGIVSATGRGGLNIEDYEDFIQTDAAINPGNSGGPLVNVRGEVVGINTAILSRSGGNQGIGFAVPSNMARGVMKQLVDNGRVVRGYLGVMIQPVSQSVAKAFDLKEAKGALVGDVEADGPAAKAGLKTGDVIIGVDGKQVQDARSLRLQIASTQPDTKVNLQVMRDGQSKDIPVTLGELPTKEQRAAGGPQEQSGALDGVNVDNLTPGIAGQLGLSRDASGVVVTGVQQGSTAAEAGLRRGDVIQEVNRKAVNDVGEYERAVRQAGGGQVLLLVNRGGSTSFVVVETE